MELDKDLEKKELEEELEKEVIEKENEEHSSKEENASSDQEDDNKTRYLRLAADFANYKKRSERERIKIHGYANEKIVTEMLDLLDNFDRAFAQEEFKQDPFMEGMLLIYKQLLDILQKAGLSEIDALGQPFNPEFHDALMMEVSDNHESGQVIEVFKKGYMFNQKVIRPTLVKVAQ